MRKKILIVGAGSGIGSALLASISNQLEFDVFGISRRGVSYNLHSEIVTGLRRDLLMPRRWAFWRIFLSKKRRSRTPF